MRWSFIFIVLMASAFSLAPKHTEAAPIPIRIVVLQPSDYPQYVSPAEAMQMALQFAQIEQSWLTREVGKTFDFYFQCGANPCLTSHSIAYFGDNGDETSTPDPCGEYGVPLSGAGNSHVWEVLNQEFGVPDQGVERIWVYILGAGGTSQGIYYGGGQVDLGRAIMGDWGLARLAGHPVPCDPLWYPMSTGVAVETGHSMDIDSENPLLCLELAMPCSFMTSSQKRDMKNHNRAFLRDP